MDRSPDGVEWTILAGDDDGDSFLTLVRRSQRGPGGPVGHGRAEARRGRGGQRMAGQADCTPPFVLLRTAPTVESAVVITESGTRRELTLFSVVDEFGLRFAAGPLPEDGEPFTLEVEVAGKGLIRSVLPWPPRRPCPSAP